MFLLQRVYASTRFYVVFKGTAYPEVSEWCISFAPWLFLPKQFCLVDQGHKLVDVFLHEENAPSRDSAAVFF